LDEYSKRVSAARHQWPGRHYRAVRMRAASSSNQFNTTTMCADAAGPWIMTTR